VFRFIRALLIQASQSQIASPPPPPTRKSKDLREKETEFDIPGLIHSSYTSNLVTDIYVAYVTVGITITPQKKQAIADAILRHLEKLIEINSDVCGFSQTCFLDLSDT